MKTSRLHTLREVLETGITVDNISKPIPISAVFIPKIQRSYAQGRINETDVRTDFLKDIFATLASEKDETLELSFLFGSKQKLIVGGEDGFELLDGQQRTTTMYLLYWYIYSRESETMPDFLKHFTYETRDTSTQFLSKISSVRMCFDEEKPSSIIKANKWFTDDFYCDATISAMLNTLDDIHRKYIEIGCMDLMLKLDRLKFYVLLLEKFDRNDELYIKMNSRGLSLIPFENFKASVVQYMKDPARNGVYEHDSPSSGKMPYWLDFTSKIDAKWIDIFWENPTINLVGKDCAEIIDIQDKVIGSNYFRFFNRYFFTKAALLAGVENRKVSVLPDFFYNNVESDDAEQRLKGWDNYEILFELIKQQPGDSIPVFGDIAKILDVFHSHYSEIRELVRKDPYGNTKAFDVRIRDGYTLSNRVVFAAITEFIEAMPPSCSFENDIVKENFIRMLRIVHNIIENTLIETQIAAIGVISAISEIIRLPGAIDDNFYKSLAITKLKSRNQQLEQEQIKAKEMFDVNGEFDQTWEQAFITAESHPFFKGAVNFFFTPGAGTSKDFMHRYEVMKELFDEKGISLSYRNNHVLIRAILSCLNHWASDDKFSGMQNRYFTENAEKEKYLKNTIIGCPEVKALFCNYFQHQGVTMVDYLNDVIIHASPDPNEGDESFKMLYSRLINDTNASKIFDWVDTREHEKGKRFRIQNNRSYIIAIPGTWYDQLVLDTERHLIISDFVSRLGFAFADKNQEQCMNLIGDSWGWRIDIKKKITGKSGIEYEFRIAFNEWKNACFYVYGDVNLLIGQFYLTANEIESGRVLVASIPYRYMNNKQPLEDKIKEVESKLMKL